MLMQKLVIGLAVLYVMSFLGGFLQATPFNFLNYVFFFLLFAGGLWLTGMSVKSELGGMTRGTLFLTGISSALLFLLFVPYEWFRYKGYGDLEASIEGFLYLTTLVFWILVIASLVLMKKAGGSVGA